MWLPLMAVMMVAIAGALQAQERVAGQTVDAQVNWETITNKLNVVNSQNQALASTITKMQVCSAAKMFYAPSDPAKDGNDCVSAGNQLVQTGTADNGGSWTTRQVKVTFPKAFTNTPKVSVATQGYYYRGSCSVNEVSFAPAAYGVTNTGFTVIFPAFADGCNRLQLQGITWIATGT
jgi:hypothetical protein